MLIETNFFKKRVSFFKEGLLCKQTLNRVKNRKTVESNLLYILNLFTYKVKEDPFKE